MLKLDYLKQSIERGLYLKRDWVVSFFGILLDETRYDKEGLRYELRGKNLYVAFEDGEINEKITDFVFDKPLFDIAEAVTLPQHFIPMIKEPVKTTFGMFALNLYLLHYPYGNLADYINEPVKASKFDAVADKLFRSKTVTVDQHVKYENGCGFITLFGQLGVPSVTPEILTPNDRILKLRDELLEKHKDQLDDPIVIAGIMDAIANEVRAMIKDTPAEDFLVGSKAIQPGLLRTKYIFGSEPDFYEEGKISFIASSLSEGWNYEDFGKLINAQRAGSIDRGGNTALAGVVVKGISRATQDYKIAIPDCGTRRTIPIRITAQNSASYIGRFDGEGVEYTEDRIKKAIGSTIHIRSPGRCEAEPHPTYCEKCFGRTVAEGGVSVNGLAFKMMSTNLAIFMSGFHTTVLSTAKYTVDECLY